MWKNLTLIALVVLAGCDTATGPEIPADAVAFYPPPVYADWWADVEHRSGVTAPMSDVRWFVVESGPWYSDRYKTVVHGIWTPDSEIYLARGFTDFENLVKHEMLHELLKDVAKGDPEHRHPLFDRWPLTVVAGN